MSRVCEISKNRGRERRIDMPRACQARKRPLRVPKNCTTAGGVTTQSSGRCFGIAPEHADSVAPYGAAGVPSFRPIGRHREQLDPGPFGKRLEPVEPPGTDRVAVLGTARWRQQEHQPVRFDNPAHVGANRKYFISLRLGRRQQGPRCRSARIAIVLARDGVDPWAGRGVNADISRFRKQRPVTPIDIGIPQISATTPAAMGSRDNKSWTWGTEL